MSLTGVNVEQVASGDVITVTCQKGDTFVGGNPRKTCGNDGTFHPAGGNCVTSRFFNCN